MSTDAPLKVCCWKGLWPLCLLSGTAFVAAEGVQGGGAARGRGEESTLHSMLLSASCLHSSGPAGRQAGGGGRGGPGAVYAAGEGEHVVGAGGLGHGDELELVDLDGGGEGGDAGPLRGLPEIGDAEILRAGSEGLSRWGEGGRNVLFGYLPRSPL